MPTVPNSFPRPATGRAHAMALALMHQRADTQHQHQLTEQLLYERYAMCDDLLDQLCMYCTRMLRDNPEQTVDAVLEPMRERLKHQDWEFSGREIDWMFDELSTKLFTTPR